MAGIKNRVANSSLITFDLEELYPDGPRILLDIKEWLYEGLLLKEKEFRATLTSHDWSRYKGAYVAITCSTDAIVPAWAYMLITINLQPYSQGIVLGNLEQLETSIYQEIIGNLDLSLYKDKSIIIKGCSNRPVPTNAYLMLTAKMRTVAKSVMYGEACSSVPLFKRK